MRILAIFSWMDTAASAKHFVTKSFSQRNFKMKRPLMWFIMFFFIGIPWLSYAQENLFYILRNDTIDSHSLIGKTLIENKKNISGLIAQAYEINEKGEIKEKINPSFVTFCQNNHVKLYAMVTNEGFDQNKVNHFLENKSAQNKAIKTLVQLCQQNHLTGLQIDFEHISSFEKYHLNEFADALSKALHQNDCQLSFTLFPRLSDVPLVKNDYWADKFNNWSGIYDYQELARVSDFVTLMAYDQHIGSTPPGPVAGIPWDQALIEYTLQYVPKEKLSLGIPVYSDHWFSGIDHGNSRYLMENMTYSQVKTLMKQLNTSLTWDSLQQVPFTFFIQNHLNEYIFSENKRSFEAKENLVKKYNLRGFSVWRIGVEDPKIWQEVKK